MFFIPARHETEDAGDVARPAVMAAAETLNSKTRAHQHWRERLSNRPRFLLDLGQIEIAKLSK
jgi:hypothetical protein